MISQSNSGFIRPQVTSIISTSSPLVIKPLQRHLAFYCSVTALLAQLMVSLLVVVLSIRITVRVVNISIRLLERSQRTRGIMWSLNESVERYMSSWTVLKLRKAILLTRVLLTLQVVETEPRSVMRSLMPPMASCKPTCVTFASHEALDVMWVTLHRRLWRSTILKLLSWTRSTQPHSC